MSNETHILDLLPVYVLGSLDADEASRVEEHLLGCLICRNESNALQAVADHLSFAAPAADPSPELKDRLIQRVQATRSQSRAPVQAPSRSWLDRLLPAWSLASLVFIFILAGFNLLLWQRLNHLETVTSLEGMRAVPLIASTSASRATGFVLISADGDSGALIVDGLPPLGESQQYQLWLIRNGEKTSGAVFSTDEKTYGGTRIRAPRSLLEYTAVDITIEPTGGSPQPTGAMVLGGPLSSP
ncbi:MAG TPA: anti-sigma factor [Anaerolineales bacterium]